MSRISSKTFQELDMFLTDLGLLLFHFLMITINSLTSVNS